MVRDAVTRSVEKKKKATGFSGDSVESNRHTREAFFSGQLLEKARIQSRPQSEPAADALQATAEECGASCVYTPTRAQSIRACNRFDEEGLCCRKHTHKKRNSSAFWLAGPERIIAGTPEMGGWEREECGAKVVPVGIFFSLSLSPLFR